MAQLAEIANYVYNTSGIGAKQDVSSLTFDTTKATELGLPSPNFYLWSGEEDGSYDAYFSYFNSTATGWDYGCRDFSSPLAVCLGDWFSPLPRQGRTLWNINTQEGECPPVLLKTIFWNFELLIICIFFNKCQIIIHRMIFYFFIKFIFYKLVILFSSFAWIIT